MKENNKRLRFLSEDEIQRLLEASPGHLRRILECALNTGMRRGEILTLKWSQIRNGFIYLQKTKTNEAREIPINETLSEVFKEIRKEQQLRSEHVFTFRPNEHKIKHLERAKRKAGLKPVGRTIRRVDSAFLSAVSKCVFRSKSPPNSD